jgi:hypothetical protein
MITISADGLAKDYNAGIRMLAMQNYNRTADGNTIIKNPTKEQVDEWVKLVNMDEVTPGYLRSECTIKVSTSTFTFPITEEQAKGNSPLTPTMRLLSKSDSFLVTQMGFSLMTYQMIAGQQTDIDFTSGNDWLPITYPDNYHNNGSDVTLDNGIGMFWIGSYLNLKVQKHELIPYWDCEKHLYVPTTQATTSQVPPFSLQKSGFVGNSSHFYPVQRNICFGGMRDNVMTLNLPANIPVGIKPFSESGYGVTNTLKAVLSCQGLLMQNSTVAK